MKIQCKFHARKSDATNTEKHPKWTPKGSHNPEHNEKVWERNEAEKNVKSEKRSRRRGPGADAAICAAQDHINKMLRILTRRKKREKKSLTRLGHLRARSGSNCLRQCPLRAQEGRGAGKVCPLWRVLTVFCGCLAGSGT